jgi:hypothetical protein
MTGPSTRSGVLVTLALAGALGALGALGACAGGGEADPSGTPWVTTIDSIGDTLVVRIAGEVPASQVRTLVPELEVGSVDGAEEETFGTITEVLDTPSGGLIVVDISLPAVRVFDSRGAFVRTIGRKGSGPGEYAEVNGIVRLPSGHLALWDGGNSRMNFYSSDSAFERSWRVDLGRHGSRLLFADDAGDLYANTIVERGAMEGASRVEGLVRYDANGRVIDSIPYLTWAEDPKPARANYPGGGNSGMTWRIPFGPGNKTHLMPSGGFVSGFGDPYVFYILPRGERPRRVEREHGAVPVSAKESAERRALMEFRLRTVDAAWDWTGVAFPTQKAAYQELDVGGDGTVWVRISTPAEAIPAAEIPEPRMGEPPAYATTEPRVYDVYSADGRLLGRVAVPERVTLFHMSGDRVWGVRTDSLGVGYAVRMRIEPALPVAR